MYILALNMYVKAKQFDKASQELFQNMIQGLKYIARVLSIMFGPGTCNK